MLVAPAMVLPSARRPRRRRSSEVCDCWELSGEEVAVYARVTRYRAKDGAANVAQQMRARVEQEFYPQFLVNARGFRGYFIVELDGNEIVSFTLWNEKAAAEQNVAHADQYVRERMGDLLDETLQSCTGEVFFAR